MGVVHSGLENGECLEASEDGQVNRPGIAGGSNS